MAEELPVAMKVLRIIPLDDGKKTSWPMNMTTSLMGDFNHSVIQRGNGKCWCDQKREKTIIPNTSEQLCVWTSSMCIFYKQYMIHQSTCEILRVYDTHVRAYIYMCVCVYLHAKHIIHVPQNCHTATPEPTISKRFIIFQRREFRHTSWTYRALDP